MDERPDEEIIKSIVNILNTFTVIIEDKIEVLKNLLNSLKDKNSINTIMVNDLSVLRYGTIHREVDIAEILLKFGANPNKRNSDGNIPLYIPDIIFSTEMLELFLSYRFDPNTKAGDLNLFNYCFLFNTDCSEHVKILLKYGASPSLQLKNPIIKWACTGGRFNVVKILLDYYTKDKFNLDFFEKLVEICESNFLDEMAEILKNHIEENIGIDSLKTICLKDINFNNFSLVNLPESFLKY